MLYLIGLGLDLRDISVSALERLRKCKVVYLEKYTARFPYSKKDLEDFIEKKILVVERDFVESCEMVDEAKKKDVALLVYGSPLFATTHVSLISEARASKVKYKIFYNASVFDSIAETGLQLYKFGKVTSMPEWKPSYTPKSFIEVVKDNEKIQAHSLILIDPGLKIKEAINQLEISANEFDLKIKKLVICQCLGSKNSKVLYKSFEEAKQLTGVREPYCLIIPGKLHFVEEEFLKNN